MQGQKKKLGRTIEERVEKHPVLGQFPSIFMRDTRRTADSPMRRRVQHQGSSTSSR